MEHGKVTTVNYKEGAVYCNVRAIRLNNEYQDVPVMKTHSGFIEVPKQGMTVAMDSLKDGTRFISHVISREEARPDDLSEGDMAIQLDDSTKVTLTKNGDKYNVALEASGDVNIKADGEVLIEGISFSNHTHPHEDSTISDTSDGSGSKSTASKTTGKPQ